MRGANESKKIVGGAGSHGNVHAGMDGQDKAGNGNGTGTGIAGNSGAGIQAAQEGQQEKSEARQMTELEKEALQMLDQYGAFLMVAKPLKLFLKKVAYELGWSAVLKRLA